MAIETPTRPLLACNKEAAKLLSVGLTSLYKLIREGRVHAVHLGRSARFSTRELESLVDELLEAASEQ